jgi:hypothetical protein
MPGQEEELRAILRGIVVDQKNFGRTRVLHERPSVLL